MNRATFTGRSPENSGTQRPLRVLHVNTTDVGGGAASVAGNLARGCLVRGVDAWEAVGWRTSDNPHVVPIPDDPRWPLEAIGYSVFQQRLRRRAAESPGRGWGLLSRSIRLAAHPRAFVQQIRGGEDFEFPGSHDLLTLTPDTPDIVHCHNLHGGYFDLRAIRTLSARLPLVLTLHDAWLLSGHCAHSFDCERWQRGCGSCPDLTIYPRIRRDATALNWRRKRDIYAGSRLYVTTPCDWLMRKVEQSMLAPAIEQARVIPNGVDRSTFHPENKETARTVLGLPSGRPIVLLPMGRLSGPWSDVETLNAAITMSVSRIGTRQPLFVSAGTVPREIDFRAFTVRQLPASSDPRVIARYYQAADIYLHCTRADTFPGAVLEALACGTPVVASATGGIPEQIKPASAAEVRAHDGAVLDGATGMLVPPADAGAMADALAALLAADEARALIGRNAVEDVRARFDLNQQVERYLSWYGAIIEHRNRHATRGRDRTLTPAASQNTTAVD